jgi:hypothetical protein
LPHVAEDWCRFHPDYDAPGPRLRFIDFFQLEAAQPAEPPSFHIEVFSGV